MGSQSAQPVSLTGQQGSWAVRGQGKPFTIQWRDRPDPTRLTASKRGARGHMERLRSRNLRSTWRTAQHSVGLGGSPNQRQVVRRAALLLHTRTVPGLCTGPWAWLPALSRSPFAEPAASAPRPSPPLRLFKTLQRKQGWDQGNGCYAAFYAAFYAFYHLTPVYSKNSEDGGTKSHKI